MLSDAVLHLKEPVTSDGQRTVLCMVKRDVDTFTNVNGMVMYSFIYGK